MRLADITGDFWNYLDLERHRNEGSPSGFSALYRPRVGLSRRDRGAVSIQLPLFELELRDVAPVGTGSDVARTAFPVHPDMAERFQRVTGASVVDTIPAAATSSGRTLFAEFEGKPQFIKLSYHGLLGRVTRRMSPSHLVTAIEVSSALRQSLSAQPIPRFAIHHEYFGANARVDDGGWGYVLRELDPFPMDQFQYRVPAFALFSRRLGEEPITPLLSEMLQLRPDLRDEAVFFSEFIKPVQDAYFLLLERTGLQIEAHAQNLIYHFDDEWKVVAAVYRDMESVDKDVSLIEEMGLQTRLTPMPHKSLSRVDPNYAKKHSFMYDFKLGEYLLRPLCDMWAAHTGHAAQRVYELARANARSNLSRLPNDFFPPDWYDYEAEVFEGRADRPYVAHPSPDFR